MKWSATFQRTKQSPWEYAPLIGESSSDAWRQFSTWRLTSSTDYYAVSVQPISEPHRCGNADA